MSGAAEPAAQAAIQEAIKASGAIVKIEPNEFSNLISKMDDGIVIEKGDNGFFDSGYKYSTSDKGFIFYCKSKNQINDPVKTRKNKGQTYLGSSITDIMSEKFNSQKAPEPVGLYPHARKVGETTLLIWCRTKGAWHKDNSWRNARRSWKNH